MNTTSSTSSTTLNKLQLSLKWSWAGPAAGLVCMIALLIAGIVTSTPGMVVMAGTVSVALCGVWVGTNSSLRRKIAQAEQR